MLLKSVRGFTPTYGENCFIAENATLIGDLVMGQGCSVWYQAVVRGDVNSIRVGDFVNIQDGAVIHATYEKAATLIGNNVSIGHNAIVHGRLGIELFGSEGIISCSDSLTFCCSKYTRADCEHLCLQ